MYGAKSGMLGERPRSLMVNQVLSALEWRDEVNHLFSMTIKITFNKAALDRLADLFKQMGETADAVGEAADTVRRAAERAQSYSAIRSWGAASFASLLERLFRRRQEPR
jgi:hypothetical protein